MEKPLWRVRSSRYLVQSEHMRLRSDEVELPNGTVLPEYYIRESDGFVTVFALTPDQQAVLVRQYRYGVDQIIVELPAGSIDAGEEPLDCAKRELLEETGYSSPRWEHVFSIPAEPVRSNSVMHLYIAHDAQPTSAQALDPTESIEPYTVSLPELRATLREGAFGALSGMAAAYAALDHLSR